ncbi:leucine-rich repeat-containing protein 27 isoform X3 [Pseudophryne corroboree]|uniref:leucine-rich repeat-containing protein 27 isoform X3 n=1 Tax=Pseudophryne corroboree TaxID=495146 RepID=UPI003081ACC5
MDTISSKDNITHNVIVNYTGNSMELLNGNRSSSNSDTLDLSKKKLHYLSEDLYRDTPDIKNLHLEGNALCSLPDGLFLHLPYLVWLDLRYNEITSLPVTIGKHRQLKYLLLEGNPIKTLPIELVELPPVEKLNLKELMKSSLDLSDDWSTKEEMKQFEMLRNKIKEKEMEEMFQVGPLHFHSKPQKVLGPVRRQAITMERRKSEEKERLAAIYQKQRNQEILKDWQKQTQDQKAKTRKRTESLQEVPIAVPPYATDLDPSQSKNSWDKQRTLVVEKQEMMPRVMSEKSLKEAEKARASRDRRLEDRIKQHMQDMQERKRNPQRSAQEEVEAAQKDLEMASLLQAEILRRRQEQDTSLEYRFTAFTGDVSPSAAPRGRPNNIFAMNVI